MFSPKLPLLECQLSICYFTNMPTQFYCKERPQRHGKPSYNAVSSADQQGFCTRAARFTAAAVCSWTLSARWQHSAWCYWISSGLVWSTTFCLLFPQASQRDAAYWLSTTRRPSSCAHWPPHSKTALQLQLLRHSEEWGEHKPSITPQAGTLAATCPVSRLACCSALQSYFCKYPSNRWSVKTSPTVELPHH